MALHLTSDNHKNAQIGDKVNHLAAVRYSSENHLVCIRQLTSWTNKEFVQKPDATRWCACMGTGKEATPSSQSGSVVKTDTDLLVSAVSTATDSLSWRSGYHPCFNFFARGIGGPYSKRTTLPQGSAEFAHALVAYRFNLHYLHFSKLSSYSAYLRVYCPSLAFQRRMDSFALYWATLVNGGLYNGASTLCARVSTDLPSPSSTVASGYDAWEFYGTANNGRTVTSDTNLNFYSLDYNPYHGDDLATLPVYVPNRRAYSGTTPPSDLPTRYYHDYQITNADNLDVLDLNPGRIWVTLHFSCSNGFADGSAYNAMAANTSAHAWFYRADLVLKCTGSAFK